MSDFDPYSFLSSGSYPSSYDRLANSARTADHYETDAGTYVRPNDVFNFNINARVESSSYNGSLSNDNSSSNNVDDYEYPYYNGTGLRAHRQNSLVTAPGLVPSVTAMPPTAGSSWNGYVCPPRGHTPLAGFLSGPHLAFGSYPTLPAIPETAHALSAPENGAERVKQKPPEGPGNEEETVQGSTSLLGQYRNSFTDDEQVEIYLKHAGTLLQPEVDPTQDDWDEVEDARQDWACRVYNAMIEMPANVSSNTKVTLRAHATDQRLVEATAYELVRQTITHHEQGIKTRAMQELKIVESADKRLLYSERLEKMITSLKEEKTNVINVLAGPAEITRLVVAPISTLRRQVTNRKNNEGKAERLAWEKAHRSSPRSAKKTKSVDRGRITKRS